MKGTQQRLKDIEDALSGRPITSETCSSRSQIPAIPLTGREKRLKDIEDALAGKFVPSGVTQINTPAIRVPNLKRASCATPEPPPSAKRRQLSPDSSPLPSPTSASSCSSFGSLPGSSTTDATSLVHSSPSPEPVVQSLPEEVQVPRRHVAQYELPANVNFYIEQFFRQYPAFPFRPSEPVSAQFYRLCDSQDWDRGDVRRKKAFKDYKDALTQTFNITYGTEVKALRSWQSLCHVLAIKPVPKSLTACQDAVLSRHVNIVDLVDSPRTGRRVEVFPTEMELSIYTIKTGKFFPRENAYSGGLLKFLLRHIFNPSSTS